MEEPERPTEASWGDVVVKHELAEHALSQEQLRKVGLVERCFKRSDFVEIQHLETQQHIHEQSYSRQRSTSLLSRAILRPQRGSGHHWPASPQAASQVPGLDCHVEPLLLCWLLPLALLEVGELVPWRCLRAANTMVVLGVLMG